ncbi:nucleoside deaminase [Amycolatopsis taiwanensis]|uniref:nucleoside deaminase n=1 Tax=Amycolatopsis taiwanensis TaxID=342230 RepID=UPI00146FC2D8|nr:nucleoside deaminase [Amycolatopsis taiwanensis]
MSDPPHESLAERAVRLAVDNVAAGGKPFACIVVDAGTGEVLAEATNQVTQRGDPTAHAEIEAIRQVAAGGHSDLAGCEVYVTAYPCPMCLGALYYAQPEKVFFAATRQQEGEYYEDGTRYMSLGTFYDEYAKPTGERSLPTHQAVVADAAAPFRAYAKAHPNRRPPSAR